MWKEVKTKLFWWGVGVLTGAALTADLAFARSIDMSKAGVSLWVFLAVGIFIVLLTGHTSHNHYLVFCHPFS